MSKKLLKQNKIKSYEKERGKKNKERETDLVEMNGIEGLPKAGRYHLYI